MAEGKKSGVGLRARCGILAASPKSVSLLFFHSTSLIK